MHTKEAQKTDTSSLTEDQKEAYSAYCTSVVGSPNVWFVSRYEIIPDIALATEQDENPGAVYELRLRFTGYNVDYPNPYLQSATSSTYGRDTAPVIKLNVNDSGVIENVDIPSTLVDKFVHWSDIPNIDGKRANYAYITVSFSRDTQSIIVSMTAPWDADMTATSGDFHYYDRSLTTIEFSPTGSQTEWVRTSKILSLNNVLDLHGMGVELFETGNMPSNPRTGTVYMAYQIIDDSARIVNVLRWDGVKWEAFINGSKVDSVNGQTGDVVIDADQTGAVPFVVDASGNKTAVTIGSRKSGSSVGEGSLAAGFDVSASGSYSHAEGQETNASGLLSHAEGFLTTAEGFASHAEGGKARTISGHTLSFVWNGDNSRSEDDPYTSHGAGTYNINPEGGLGGFWIGEQTLEAIIAAAISGKANKSELPYSLVVKEIKNGTVSLDDRADNYVDARTLGSSDSLDIDFPVLVDGRSRDFVIAVECGENPPTISYAAFATIMAEDASTLTPEPGMNIYAFTEFKTNMFLAARKTVDTVVVNTPESSDQVLLAMQKRGVDTTNITDFGKVANTFGLGDTATPQDAIDAVMN